MVKKGRIQRLLTCTTHELHKIINKQHTLSMRTLECAYFLYEITAHTVTVGWGCHGKQRWETKLRACATHKQVIFAT